MIADGIWSLSVPIGAPPHDAIFYAIEDSGGALHLIDAGWPSEANWEALRSQLAGIGSSVERVASVTVTHMHPDHIGLAERIRAVSGAEVRMHTVEQAALDNAVANGYPVPDFEAWGVPSEQIASLTQVATQRSAVAVTANTLLSDGDVLDIPGRTVHVIHTPGHTSGHIVLREAEGKHLFTGDHVLPAIFPGIGVGGYSPDPLGDYIRSLERVEVFDDHDVLPGHGAPFRGLAERCARIRAHQLTRSDEVATILKQTPDATVWQTASRVGWSDGWAGLRGFHLISALAQTHMRMTFARTDPA